MLFKRNKVFYFCFELLKIHWKSFYFNGWLPSNQKKRKQCLSSLNHDITENAHNMTNSVATARKNEKKKNCCPPHLYTLFQKSIFVQKFIKKKNVFGTFLSQNRKTHFFRVTYFLQIRVGWILEISKIQITGFVKIYYLDKNWTLNIVCISRS